MAISTAAETLHDPPKQESTIVAILLAISFCHMLNDIVQSLIPAIYPILKDTHHLNFTQIGLITLAFQMSASVLQPGVGLLTDRKPLPYSLVFGMFATLAGLLCLAHAASFPALLGSAVLVGVGSAVFHPESSRVARMAAGRRHGLAQSVFQVGGNFGSALGPLLGAFIVLPRGQASISWFSAVAVLAMAILMRVGHWYAGRVRYAASQPGTAPLPRALLGRAQTTRALAVLIVLMFSKFIYTMSFSSYFTFYLMEKFALSVQSAQLHLFVFLAAGAAGTIAGGPIGDRFGRRFVIWFSILGALPFALALPYANLFWTSALSVIVGFILASAFPAILVYAQELLPRSVGLVAGLFFGFAFGFAGIAAAALGTLADAVGLETVYRLVSFMPLVGLLTVFLPAIPRPVPPQPIAEECAEIMPEVGPPA